MQGQWTVAAISSGSESAFVKGLLALAKGGKVNIQADRILFHGGGQPLEFRYKLPAGGSPKPIDLYDRDELLQGIYASEDDELKIAFVDKSGEARPTTLDKPKAGARTIVITLKRSK